MLQFIVYNFTLYNNIKLTQNNNYSMEWLSYQSLKNKQMPQYCIWYLNAICKVLFDVSIQIIWYWLCSHILVYWKYIYVSIIYTSITFIIYTEFLHTTAASTHLSCIYCSVRTFFLSSNLLCFLGIKSSYFYLYPFTALHEKKPTFLLSGMLQNIWLMLQEDIPYDCV